MAIKTYYYKVNGNTALELPDLLASGAAPVISVPTTDNPFIAVTLDDSHKEDLDDAMSNLGFEFVAETIGKERSIAFADSPYSPGSELILLVDASAGAVVVDLPALALFTTSVRQIKVIKTDGSANTVTVDGAGGELINGVTTFVLSNQYDSSEIVSGPSEWHLLLAPSTSQSGLIVTTTDALLVGNIVSYDTSSPSRTVLADPSTALSPSRYDAKGIASVAALAGAVTTIFSIPGQRVAVRFAAAPAAAFNGDRVYLSTTPGIATLATPGSGNALVQIGILVGADGISVTPDVVFELNVIAIIN